ncbi:MAG TPA: Tex-like N-terminal domain-containing protein [Candidatus Mcinerneyibacterium sp.]|nr:Tex-like N-terminal domain-containing protein [Candidatus Mcinerneyibacterium sp.]
MDIVKQISRELSIKSIKINNTVKLLKKGNTIPFISRYRKEKTGNLDEVTIRTISNKLAYYEELKERKKYILKTIKEQDELTEELEEKIKKCLDKTELEDLYLPYKPKKKTKAGQAIKMGFEPLAKKIYEQNVFKGNKKNIILKFKNENKKIIKLPEIIKQAKYIVVSYIKDDSVIRKKLRDYFERNSILKTEKKNVDEDKKKVYKDYYNYKEKIDKIKSHRLLAINRAEDEDVISMDLIVNESEVLNLIKDEIIKNDKHLFNDELNEAIEMAYYGYLAPSISNEIINKFTEKAESVAIDVFEKNLESLLMGSPASDKNILGIDPGLRTGSKLAVIDKNGNYLAHEVVDVLKSQETSFSILENIIDRYNIELIALGNGKGSKEISNLIKKLTKKFNINKVLVNESGASIYSASPIAVEEFPELDVTIRGAISIARRVHDPLAELVKIDPKSLGIGQYQHDVNQTKLKDRLNYVVTSVVNKVGVDINSASRPLLSYVSGVSEKKAQNIIEYKKSNNGIKSREELLEIDGIGPKTYEQCAGFLRIRNGKNILDNTAIHPENYSKIKEIIKKNDFDLNDIVKDKSLIDKLNNKKYESTLGKYTLNDIIEELKKPGRDIRDKFEPIPYSEEIETIKDVQKEMELVGTITNITNFGMFIDLGIGTNGLCHISNTLDKYVDDLNDHFKIGEWFYFKVINVDYTRERISLSLINKN